MIWPREILDEEQVEDWCDPKTGQWYRVLGDLMFPITGKGGDLIEQTEDPHPENAMTEEEYLKQVQELNAEEEEETPEEESQNPAEDEEEEEEPEPDPEEIMKKGLAKYGRMRMSYLRDYHPKEYAQMMKDGTLNRHCGEVEIRAQELKKILIERMAKAWGAVEALKQGHSIEYIRIMENCLESAEEIVLNQIVYS